MRFVTGIIIFVLATSIRGERHENNQNHKIAELSNVIYLSFVICHCHIRKGKKNRIESEGLGNVVRYVVNNNKMLQWF